VLNRCQNIQQAIVYLVVFAKHYHANKQAKLVRVLEPNQVAMRVVPK